MGLKRNFVSEGSDSPHIPNESQCLPTKFQKVCKNHAMKDVTLQELAVKISAILEPAIRRVVKEEVESLALLQPSLRKSLVHPLESSSSRGLQLHFSNKLPPTLFTNSSIRDQEYAPLQLILVDARSDKVIDHGTLCSMKVEILVLSADFATDGSEDWSESEFSASIVREREGKRPLLVGDLFVTLVNGVGCVGNISFTDNSSWVRSRKFRLGVRAVSSASRGIGIREAVSEAFVVLDHRGASYKKHSTPSLVDPVWRLRKISKLGASHNKLESYGIRIVKDFLMWYHMDPDALRNILGRGISNRAWETMVNHANECPLDTTQYSYYSAVERVELMFNCVYKVMAVKFEGQHFCSFDTLDMHQKALVDSLKRFAFKNQNEIVLLQSPFASTSANSSSIQQNVPIYGGADLDMQPGGFWITDREVAEQQLDYNISESTSQPCTVDSASNLEDDSTTGSDHQPGYSPSALLMDDLGTDEVWFQNAQITSFSPGDPQTLSLYPVPMTWATSARIDILSLLPNFSGNSRINPRARWCMIRAVVMWIIVVRRTAARRKHNLPFFCCCW